MVVKSERRVGRYSNITGWPEWPAMLARMEELVSDGMDGRAARLLTAKEFDITTDVLLYAVGRGDVPCIPSPDRARVQANLEGETKYQGEPCAKCGGRERWVGDGCCTECRMAYDRAYAERRKLRSNA